MDQAHLFEHVRAFSEIDCHLATAKAPDGQDHWAVLSNQPPSLKLFELYGKRFGGIEPHFKDYKSAGFEVLDSGLRDAQALTCLLGCFISWCRPSLKVTCQYQKFWTTPSNTWQYDVYFLVKPVYCV
jgi:hypothetical protein